MSNRFVGQVALVTGAGSGIGRAIAERFGREGARVAIADVRADAAAAVAKELEGLGAEALALPTDITIEAQVAAMVGAVAARWGRLDILVNNAGTTVRKSLAAMSYADWQRVLDLNLGAVFLCTKYAAEVMKRAGAGRIVNVASISGLVGFGYGPYCASKAGVVGFTRITADELARFGITVNCIAPGTVETPLTEQFLINPQIWERQLALIPLRRFGRPADIAGAAAFLASEDASFITGTVLVVDGGTTAALQLGDAADAFRSVHEQAPPADERAAGRD